MRHLTLPIQVVPKQYEVHNDQTKERKKRGKRCSSGLVKDEIQKRIKHGNIYVTIKLFKTFSEKKKKKKQEM